MMTEEEIKAFILLTEQRNDRQERINKGLNDISSATFVYLMEIDELLKRMQQRINEILEHEENDQILH